MNADTFAGYYRRYSDRLRHAMTARTGDPDRGEDATAAAFAAAWEKIDRFRGDSSFYTYLYRIGVNDQIQNWRRHGRTVSLDALTAEPKVIAETEAVTDELEKSDCCRRLQRALRALPTIYRMMLLEHFVYGRSVRQIGGLYHIPVGTVLSRLHTARRLLRRKWKVLG
jgi:RNA polymerase sigma-70 factor (ECF subfamily)